ncbi:hypothetical protein [Hyphomicrobium sp.]|uniref:hypothetical protein n=1 Tax=Hyphomicrobium sp. TaxID=82 RepID=UPI001D89EA69|nr:hypothetical protein [Hyphomicrobium sp.]MBY0562442.1 hypothetical protein [Hyphomicrobium sp.]
MYRNAVMSDPEHEGNNVGDTCGRAYADAYWTGSEHLYSNHRTCAGTLEVSELTSAVRPMDEGERMTAVACSWCGRHARLEHSVNGQKIPVFSR